MTSVLRKGRFPGTGGKGILARGTGTLGPRPSLPPLEASQDLLLLPLTLLAVLASPLPPLDPSTATSFSTGDPALDRLQDLFKTTLEANRKEFRGATGTVKGFGAGREYPQIWLRDSSTLIPLARYLYPREFLTSWIEEHLAHQDPGGGLLDWIASGPTEAFAPWAPHVRLVSPPGVRPLSSDRNTVEKDQESSAVLALCAAFSITGDKSWLQKDVAGRPLLERANDALRFLLADARDPASGLVTSGFSADWGDVSPTYPDQRAIYLDAATPRVAGLYTNVLAARAALDLGRVYEELGLGVRAAYWREQGLAIETRINRALWQEGRGFYRMHIPAGSVPPPDFDDSDLFPMGGNALAVLDGVADDQKVRAILDVAERRRKAYGASTVADVLLPPYPKGLFKHPAMKEEFRYQNGGQWDWFAGRLLTGAFKRGHALWARAALLEIGRKALTNGGLYEWGTREGAGRGSPTYAGSAGALAEAVYEGLFGVTLTWNSLEIAVRLSDRPGRIELYEPATETSVAYTYVPRQESLALDYRSSREGRGHLLVLLPPGRRAARATLDGKPASLAASQVGDDRYVSLETSWSPHRLEISIEPLLGPPADVAP